jgi:transcription elongation factor Elf1
MARRYVREDDCPECAATESVSGHVDRGRFVGTCSECGAELEEDVT